MATTNRIFIAFAVEDVSFRDLLKGQARNERTPFEFVDMSVKEPWASEWKVRVRARIKGCDGVIALLSENTYAASGARYEMQCANEEFIPMIALRVKRSTASVLYGPPKTVLTPPELRGSAIIDWTWAGIANFLNSL